MSDIYIYMFLIHHADHVDKDAVMAETTPCFRFAAHIWVFAVQMLTSQKKHSIAMMVEKLRSLRADLLLVAKEREDDIDAVATKIKLATQRGLAPRSTVVVGLLKKSMAFKKLRDDATAKINTIELQISALESSEMNRVMLSTMKNSTDTMKKLGLEQAVAQADSTMSDLEDTINLSGEMNTVLSTQVVTDNHMNDDDLDEELLTIMNDNFEVDSLSENDSHLDTVGATEKHVVHDKTHNQATAYARGKINEPEPLLEEAIITPIMLESSMLSMNDSPNSSMALAEAVN